MEKLTRSRDFAGAFAEREKKKKGVISRIAIAAALAALLFLLGYWIYATFIVSPELYPMVE